MALVVYRVNEEPFVTRTVLGGTEILVAEAFILPKNIEHFLDYEL